jgi:hypothetical protein
MNYLLKMPSDLDYLDEYLAIRKWIGFPLARNPFCVPYPMEEGVDLFSGEDQLFAHFFLSSSEGMPFVGSRQLFVSTCLLFY